MISLLLLSSFSSYHQIWVEYVVRNPLWTLGTPVTSDIFKAKLDEFVKQSPLYGSKII